MRLNLTLPELEAGKADQVGASERILEMCISANKRDPFPISPLRDHDQRIISMVMFTEDSVRLGPGRCRLAFRPLWNKTFTLYDKQKLLALIIELPSGQFWVNEQGFTPCRMTTNGNGTDPKTVHNAQFTLADLMSESRRPYPVMHAIELLKKCG